MRHRALFQEDRVKAQIIDEQRRYIVQSLERARERKADLTVRSRAERVFVLPQAENLPGRYVRKGQKKEGRKSVQRFFQVASELLSRLLNEAGCPTSCSTPPRTSGADCSAWRNSGPNASMRASGANCSTWTSIWATCSRSPAAVSDGKLTTAFPTPSVQVAAGQGSALRAVAEAGAAAARGRAPPESRT